MGNFKGSLNIFLEHTLRLMEKHYKKAFVNFRREPFCEIFKYFSLPQKCLQR